MTVSVIPVEPEVSAEQRASGQMVLRFEDVSQGGRLVLEALPNALGEVWRRLGESQRGRQRKNPGVVPILSRALVEGGEGPISPHAPVEVSGCFELAHTVGADGEVERILLGMWATVSGVAGRAHPPAPPDAGRRLVAGRVFAEHVFTRPFAPAADRKVRALDLGDGPTVPPARYAWGGPEETLTLPEGASPLDPELAADGVSTVFGLDHTDSNQHVNSLVYSRLFVEAALRRLADHGLASPPLLARSVEIAYRKPCFAGERVRIATRAFTAGSRTGAVAAVLADGDAAGAGPVRPRCFARLLFER